MNRRGRNAFKTKRLEMSSKMFFINLVFSECIVGLILSFTAVEIGDDVATFPSMDNMHYKTSYQKSEKDFFMVENNFS